MKREAVRSVRSRSVCGRAIWIIFTLCLVLTLAGTACNKSSNSNSKDFDAEDLGKDPPNLKKGVKPEPDSEVAVIEMQDPGYGRIVIELYPNLAPQMVARFKQLIKEGFYNGTTFHRTGPQLIQGGDPLSKDDDPRNDGTGNSPYPNLPAELSDVSYVRGMVGAARKGPSPAFGDRPALTAKEAYDTANCQFFITLMPMPQLDGQYTLFGRVIDGLGTADLIAGAPRTPGTEHPADKINIKSIPIKKKG